MARRLIGSATTNSNGVATITYNSASAGKLKVIAVATIDDIAVSSEELVLWDCYLKDDGTQNETNLFSNTSGIIRGTNSVQFYYDNTNGATAYQSGFSTHAPINDGVAYDMEVFDVTYFQVQIGRYEEGLSANYVRTDVESDGLLHIEVLPTGTYFYMDDVLVYSNTTYLNNTDATLFIRGATGKVLDFKYKNLKVYPI